jgi:glycosyltransferase involved in cell wall biosynthesis
MESVLSCPTRIVPAATGSLSVVVPAFNEETRLPPTLAILRDSLPQAEILVVDDGSGDGTSEAARAAGVRVLSYAPNRGKGFAVRTGVAAARGDWILVTDADLSTPLDELPRFLAATGRGDVIIGTRTRAESRVVRPQPRLRAALSRCFTVITQFALELRTSDFTCGFKLFRREAARELFRLQRLDRWGYDAEILYLAARLNLRVVEIPVTWGNDDRTRVRLARDIFRTIRELVEIRWNEARGLYRR